MSGPPIFVDVRLVGYESTFMRISRPTRENYSTERQEITVSDARQVAPVYKVGVQMSLMHGVKPTHIIGRTGLFLTFY